MLGNQIGEASGKITNVRVLEYAGARSRVEVTFQGQGKVGNTGITDIGSYWQEIRPGGEIYGEGGPLWMTDDGEMLSWKGFGVGRRNGAGFSASFGCAGTIETSSEQLAHLNGVVAIGEYETDADGNYRWTLWEWTGQG
jgi:hypothetical protein